MSIKMFPVGFGSSKRNKDNNISSKEGNSSKNFLTGIKKAAPVVLPLASIPLAALVTHKVNSKHNAQIWSALIGIAGLGGAYTAGNLTAEQKEDISRRAEERVNAALNGQNTLNRKYTTDYNGITLLNTSDNLNLDSVKLKKAHEKIESAAVKRLNEAPDVKPILKENPTLWSVSSEFAPVKEGGLGSVPVELQNNMSKLGIDVPTFIPMYQQRGIASFRKENGKYFYTYKGREFELDKAASFKLDTYQDGKSKTEDVSFYTANLGKDDNGADKKLVFVHNDTYFNGTIYQSSEKTEEPEKFAFFSKAVYEFAKAKADKNSVKGLVISDRDAFDSIKFPDGLILNDWQASPIAALARYKAPMENAYKQLSNEAAEKLSDMRIITIGHNATYQGSTSNNNDNLQRHTATSNILNTLFDNYAFDIVSHAKTAASEDDITDYGLRNLDNVLILNDHDYWANHTNLLNMGVCLSDYFHPVSENYAKEIISDEHPELAWELRWALNKRAKAGSLIGIINGNDFANLNIEAKKEAIKNTAGFTPETYSKDSSTEEIMKARLHNKIAMYNEFMIPFTRKDTNDESDKVRKIRSITERFEMVNPTGETNLPVLSDEELAAAPILSSAGRLVSQKGVKLMSDAIKMLYDNWDEEFPGKPKPLFYLAGQDGEGGTQRAHIENLKKELDKDDSDRVIFGHGFAPMQAIMASSDFFMLPSLFEPCGLTQGESFALATPVIGSAVGGIVDTVNRNGKTNGILTDKNSKLTPEEFYNAMKTALHIYFDEPEKYKSMVKDSLAEDFSWIQKGKNGPVYDYLDKIGIKRENLPDVD